MNKCPHCLEEFNGYVEYQEHLILSHLKPQELNQSPFHEDKPLESNAIGLKTYSSGRIDLQRQEWKGYMAKKDKIKIVNRIETKLGPTIIIERKLNV